ncbi:hypothetical protein N0V88_007416 [Collariella sp. IMI 366227]|nr:hypothetical protein N0V88_007416 [Collariella sp. IMI 366227]
MPARQKTRVVLTRSGDWIDWYDSLLNTAREDDLENLVDLEAKKLVAGGSTGPLILGAYTKAKRLKVPGPTNDDHRPTSLEFLETARYYKETWVR